MAQIPYEYLFRLALVGDAGVGKTSLLTRFMDNRFEGVYKPAIGVDFATRTVQIDERGVRIQVWDTAGQERFRSIQSAYYRGVESIALVYDVTSRKSYMNLAYWMKEVHEKARPDAVVVLIATKSDLGHLRQVSCEEGRLFAAEYGMTFVETSARDDDGGVDAAFMRVFTEVYLHKRYRELNRLTANTAVRKPTIGDTLKNIWLSFLPFAVVSPTRCW